VGGLRAGGVELVGSRIRQTHGRLRCRLTKQASAKCSSSKRKRPPQILDVMIKRILIAVPPAVVIVAIAAAEAFAGRTPQHAQLLGRITD
jgi:hypothetical protein